MRNKKVGPWKIILAVLSQIALLWMHAITPAEPGEKDPLTSTRNERREAEYDRRRSRRRARRKEWKDDNKRTSN